MITLTLTAPEYSYLARAVERDLDDVRTLVAFGEDDGFVSDVRLAEAVLVKMAMVDQTQVYPY